MGDDVVELSWLSASNKLGQSDSGSGTLQDFDFSCFSGSQLEDAGQMDAEKRL